MPYKHEICRAGKTKQHTFYYAVRTDTKEGSRRQKENKTCEAQKKVNSRQAVKKLTWILNANYDGTSLYITWEYTICKCTELIHAITDIVFILRHMIFAC